MPNAVLDQCVLIFNIRSRSFTSVFVHVYKWALFVKNRLIILFSWSKIVVSKSIPCIACSVNQFLPQSLHYSPTPRSSMVADMEEGHLGMLEHLLRIISERAEDDDVGPGRGTILRNFLERRQRLRERLHYEDDGVGGDLSSNSTDTEPEEEDDGIVFPSMTATRVPSLFSRRSNNNGGESPARNTPTEEEVGGRRRGYTLPHPAEISRPSFQRRPRTPPPEEPSLYHPPRQPTLVRRPPFQRRCNNRVPRADTPECDESMFQTVTSTSNDSNRFTNDLSNSPVRYPYLPPLPPILRPLDSPLQQPHTHTSPNRLSVPPSRVGPVSSSESNSSPLFGGSDYDEDEAMMTAMRESLREVEIEGQMEEGLDCVLVTNSMCSPMCSTPHST